MHESGGNCLKYLERGWSRKEGRGNKDFKKGEKLGQGQGVGAWNPPYQLCIYMKIVYETGFFINVKNLFSAPLKRLPSCNNTLTNFLSINQCGKF